MSEEKSLKILVVDDDDLLRDFYIRILKNEGFEPITAINGDEAIDALENHGEDIVLAVIDLLMPVRTGWELIEHIKQHEEYKKIPIIAITGLAASFDEFEKVNEICEAVMHKSDFELSNFIATIRKLLEQRD